MDIGLKRFFSRGRRKDRTPLVNDSLHDAFYMTSGYEKLTPGVAPKIGTVPLKPSQEPQPRRSFHHNRAKSNGVSNARRSLEVADAARPSTASGAQLAPGEVSRPGGVWSSKSRSAGDQPPAVPSLPQNLEKLRAVRHFDLLQYTSRTPLTGDLHNEDVATRNLDLAKISQDTSFPKVVPFAPAKEDVATRNVMLAPPIHAMAEVPRNTNDHDASHIAGQGVGTTSTSRNEKSQTESPLSADKTVPSRDSARSTPNFSRRQWSHQKDLSSGSLQDLSIVQAEPDGILRTAENGVADHHMSGFPSPNRKAFASQRNKKESPLEVAVASLLLQGRGGHAMNHTPHPRPKPSPSGAISGFAGAASDPAVAISTKSTRANRQQLLGPQSHIVHHPVDDQHGLSPKPGNPSIPADQATITSSRQPSLTLPLTPSTQRPTGPSGWRRMDLTTNIEQVPSIDVQRAQKQGSGSPMLSTDTREPLDVQVTGAATDLPHAQLQRRPNPETINSSQTKQEATDVMPQGSSNSERNGSLNQPSQAVGDAPKVTPHYDSTFSQPQSPSSADALKPSSSEASQSRATEGQPPPASPEPVLAKITDLGLPVSTVTSYDLNTKSNALRTMHEGTPVASILELPSTTQPLMACSIHDSVTTSEAGKTTNSPVGEHIAVQSTADHVAGVSLPKALIHTAPPATRDTKEMFRVQSANQQTHIMGSSDGIVTANPLSAIRATAKAPRMESAKNQSSAQIPSDTLPSGGFINVDLISSVDKDNSTDTTTQGLRQADASESNVAIYTTPESLKSADFINPSLAFGVSARDFAQSPTRRITAANVTFSDQKISPVGPKSPAADDAPVQDPQPQYSRDMVFQGHRKQPSDQAADFDEEDFVRKQAEARAALMRLQKSLMEDLSFDIPPRSALRTETRMTRLHDANPKEETLRSGKPTLLQNYSPPTSLYQQRDGRKGPTSAVASRQPADGAVTAATDGCIISGGAGQDKSIRQQRRQEKWPQPNCYSDGGSYSPHRSDARQLCFSAGSVIPTAAQESLDRSTAKNKLTSDGSNSWRPSHSRLVSDASSASRASAFNIQHSMVPKRLSSRRDGKNPVSITNGHTHPYLDDDDKGWE